MCLMLLVDPDRRRILLGRKLTGFGAGKVIAPGGKVEPGEDVVAAAVRELYEETGVVVRAEHARRTGEITFTWADPSRVPFRVSLVRAEAWTGEPVDTDELAPFWCALEEIPYARMWDDDRIWLPNVLRGTPIHATIGYDFAGECVETIRLQPL